MIKFSNEEKSVSKHQRQFPKIKMKFIVCVTFVLLCAPGFSRSKTVAKSEKKGKGTYLERLRHKENHYIFSNEQAEQKSVTKKFGKLIKSSVEVMGAIPFMEVPYSRGKMRYILEEQAKLAFLVKQIKLPLPVITKGMLNMELFTTADFNVAMLYNRQLNTPIKVFKYLDHKTASKMFNTPTTEFLDQSFKDYGILQGIKDLFRLNAKGLHKGHLLAARLSTEDEIAFSESYSFFNVVPMYPKFNVEIYRKMERELLKFIGEAADAEDEVHFMASVSPDCLVNDQNSLLSIEKVSNLDWLGIPQEGIVIPQSLSVIAYSVPKSKMGKIKVFAWVGNNDKDSPKGYFLSDLKELIPYFECNGDQSTLNGITALEKTGYKMWNSYTTPFR